MVSAVVFEF
ncbi:hypothetical protein VCHC48B2_3234, partial [Vibrio cholerae HC-48B2]